MSKPNPEASYYNNRMSDELLNYKPKSNPEAKKPTAWGCVCKCHTTPEIGACIHCQSGDGNSVREQIARVFARPEQYGGEIRQLETLIADSNRKARAEGLEMGLQVMEGIINASPDELRKSIAETKARLAELSAEDKDGQ